VAPVEADLVLANDGELRHSVDALLRWWQALRAV
jgi:hypothetical protein